MNDTAIASAVMMLRPAHFGANAQTAVSNRFQRQQLEGLDIEAAARAEFDKAVGMLERAGITIEVIEDTSEPSKPDAVFPNNWISFHPDGTVCLYPMEAVNRRIERRPDIPEILAQERGYRVSHIEDWSGTEQEARYLEGTGSLVLDHATHTAYACCSSRTDPGLVHAWCERFGYRPVLFHALDEAGTAIYHTNVMMCLGDGFAVICLDSIRDRSERDGIEARIKTSGRQIVSISMAQMAQFAGNMLMLQARGGTKLLVMSRRAEQSLTEAQRALLEQHARLVSIPINVIEDCGGGGIRCMMAEIFLPRISGGAADG
ncbi:MAG TPA: arginine deiminase-related protein [Gammaproteobacteria bacterium]|nr:arginine deiminase-related protein [Gammaproteobacteria bacterium]